MNLFDININKDAKIDKIKSTMLISVIVSVIVISFSLVFLKFLFDLWSYSGRVYSAQKDARDTLQTNIDAYEQLKPQFDILSSASGNPNSPDAGVVLDALPNVYDFPALAASMKKIADNSGVQLVSFSGVDEEGTVPGPSPNPVPYDIHFRIEVGGSYNDIQVFIDSLDLSIRPFEIVNIELFGSDDTLRADIRLKTYYQPTKNLNYPQRVVQ
ncbi:MAG: hypothetical protein WDZ42_02015 [Candidatus Saccharimonadales bacterium]